LKSKDTSKYPKERGDAVTPTDVAERMGQKLHRHISPYIAGYLYTTLGFVSRSRKGQAGRPRYFIVPNPELLAEKRAQFRKLVEDKN
jgi:hypothetical protein